MCLAAITFPISARLLFPGSSYHFVADRPPKRRRRDTLTTSLLGKQTMNASKGSEASSLSATAPAANRANKATQQHDSASETSSSGMDEKDSLGDSDSESARSLLLDARELEAQPELRSTSAPPEDLVSRSTKIAFVALYFFLNLSLTLSNKSVLTRVSASSPTAQIWIPVAPHGALGVFANACSTDTIYCPAAPPVASHDIAYDCNIRRHLHLDGNRPLDVDTTKLPLASHPPGVFSTVHPQYRNLQRLSCPGLCTFPPSDAIHLSGGHDSHIPHGLRSRIQQNNLLLHDPFGVWRRACHGRGLPSLSTRDSSHYLWRALGLHQDRCH